MINLTQRRLTIRFTFVLAMFTSAILTVIFLYFHQSNMQAVKRHVTEDIQREFIDQFHRRGLEPFQGLWDEFHFQILNTDGEVVVASRTAKEFYPALNRELLANASSGERVFEMELFKDDPYLIAYFPLGEKYTGRLAASLTTEVAYEKKVLRILLIVFPGILLLSYVVSRYLVRHAMKPISDAFTFQEIFSSTVGHELRSPLASLKGNLEVSLRKERSPVEYRETLALGLTEVDRIIHLLNDLSLLASSRFKPLDLFREQVNIRKVLGEVVSTYRPRAEAGGIRIDNSANSDIYSVCDESLMKRVFENILNNAVNYTPKGGLIAIRTLEAMGKMLVNISNTCKGITEDEAQYFFEPFYRGKGIANKNFDGKGLGLFIARYIVRSHGGEITAKITDNNMFSLTLSLPMK